MLEMGFCLLSALDFPEDVCGSKTVQKLNNSAVFNPSVLKENTIADLLDFCFFLRGGILTVPSHIYPAMKCLGECWAIGCRNLKMIRLSRISFRWCKEATHRAVKSKYVNAFTPLRIQSWLSDLMHAFVPSKRWPFATDGSRMWQLVLSRMTNYEAGLLLSSSQGPSVSLFRLHRLNTSPRDPEQHVFLRKFPCNPAYGNI